MAKAVSVNSGSCPLPSSRGSSEWKNKGSTTANWVMPIVSISAAKTSKVWLG